MVSEIKVSMAPSPNNNKHALVIGIDKYPQLGARYDLKGCVNDAQLMASVLKDTFSFPEGNITRLLDEQATRQGILQAMKQLADRLADDDVVVVHYSGHGSQMRDREGDEPDGFDETIVPHDSGRGSRPNLDISDDEIYAWLVELTKITPYLTLIFDCCHSGTIARDAFGARSRWVERDERPLEELPPSPVAGVLTRGTLRDIGPSGWLPLGDRYVLIAGCRDEESSYEYGPKESGLDATHGALTFFLTRELLKASSQTTYRDVFQAASAQVTMQQPRQHPQMEGAWDRQVFGVAELRPGRHVRVLQREDGKVVLAAGAAHGLHPGDRWLILDQVAPPPNKTNAELGMAEITRVGAVTSEAKIITETKPGSIKTGDHASLSAHTPPLMRFGLELVVPQEHASSVDELQRRIEGSALLAAIEPGEPAEARLYLLEPRSRTVEGDPVPQLRAVNERCWALVGQDGRLMAPLHSTDETERIIANLEKAARRKHALALTNPDPGSNLAARIGFCLMRQCAEGEWSEAVPEREGGEVVFHEGERIAIQIVNRHSAPVYLTVLDFGLSGSISQLYPVQGAAEALSPGKTITYGMRTGEELELYMPDSFPFDPDPIDKAPARGIEVFKLLVTLEPADFSPLLQESYRSLGDHLDGVIDSPLGTLLRMALTGSATRDVRRTRIPASEAWAAITRSFVLTPRAPE